MTTATHIVAPEEIMAWLDGELSSAEAASVCAHIEECAECASLADELRGTTESLHGWTIPVAPAALNSSIADLTKKVAAKRESSRPASLTRLSIWNWRLWAIGGGGAVTAGLIFAVVLSSVISYRRQRMIAFVNPEADPAPSSAARGLLASPGASSPDFVDSYADSPRPTSGQSIEGRKSDVANAVEFDKMELAAKLFTPPPQTASTRSAAREPREGGAGGHSAPAVPSTPMIARTVSLTILASDFPAARSSLDAILKRHRGYSASLTVNTPANGEGSFQASLRIPSDEVTAALGELKAMGRVVTESQSGEEVTQQHADLVARLANSREEEQRLRAILEQRTGKIEDVLQVEEEIANVRGEIESMEAQQKSFEHRVDFVTVDLQLTQEFREQLGAAGAAPSASTRMYNALVTGLRHAGRTVLGVILFFEEFGPAILIWLVLLGLPAFLLWRRYRRMREEI